MSRSHPGNQSSHPDAVNTSAWSKSVALSAVHIQKAAHRAGLGARNNTELSLESIDRRRIQMWSLIAGLLAVILISLTLIGNEFGLNLPDWLPSKYLRIGVLGVVVLLGLYVIEKEYQLRRISRYLIDEQFQTDVVTRKLKAVEILLESTKAVNRGNNSEFALKTIVRQAIVFLDEDNICLYVRQGDNKPYPAAGNKNQGLEVLGQSVMEKNQSQCVHNKKGEQGMLFAVPMTYRGNMLGALCLKTERKDLDTFETLMTLSLFSEQAATAVASAHLREQKEIEDSQQAHQTAHDPLTGLMNRSFFIERLDRLIAQYGDDAPHVALVFFSIDDLKRVNNSLGFAVGDAVIEGYAEHIRSTIPDNAIAGRFGGDEFMVALADIGGYEEAIAIAHNLKSGLNKTLTIGNRKLSVTSSMGVALPETFEISGTDLIRDAHIAIQEAKKQGGNTISRFDSNLFDSAERKFSLEEDLRRAIDNDEIGIHLQPVFDLDTREPVGLEALMRWQHPESGVVPAGSFIPFASKSGQLKEIDQRVFQKSCAAIRGLQDHGFNIPVHVNLFPHFLNSTDLVPSVKRILDTADVSPESFVIEISESDPLLESLQTQENIKRLKEIGFKVALDEFGTGTSGLGSLSHLPVDMVKIARSFISDLSEGQESQNELVSTILNLAQNLHLRVIAVGIENDRQLEILRDMGCEFGQGYFLGKPLPLKPFLDAYKPENSTIEV